MNWFYFALFSVIGTAIANIFRRIVMKDDKTDAIASTIIFQILGAIIVACFAFYNGFVLPPIAQYPINFLLQAILWGLASLFLFKASEYLEASEVTILSTFSSLVTIISAVLLLNETFNASKVIGTLLIITAVIVISLKPEKMQLNKGVLYVLGYCLCAGLGITNDTFVIKHSDTLSYLVIGFLTPGLFMMIIKPSAISQVKYFFQPTAFIKMFILTLFYTLAAIAYFFAIQSGAQASQVSPINQSSIIITILLAAIFLKERDHLWKKVICAVLVSVGVLLLR